MYTKAATIIGASDETTDLGSHALASVCVRHVHTPQSPAISRDVQESSEWTQEVLFHQTNVRATHVASMAQTGLLDARFSD